MNRDESHWKEASIKPAGSREELPNLPLSSLILSFSLYGKPSARRWTRESSGFGIVCFVQTDFPTSRCTVRGGTMRWRHSWGGDALWVSFVFENQHTLIENNSVGCARLVEVVNNR